MACVQGVWVLLYEHQFPHQKAGLCGVSSELPCPWSYTCQDFNHAEALLCYPAQLKDPKPSLSVLHSP